MKETVKQNQGDATAKPNDSSVATAARQGGLDRVAQPSEIAPAEKEKMGSGWLPRLVRCWCDSVSRKLVKVEGSANANLYAKRGWALHKTSTMYYSDERHLFNSAFIFWMVNDSALYKFLSQTICGNILKGAIWIGARALSACINQIPSVCHKVGNSDGWGYVRC